MNEDELSIEEENIPELAVLALNAATRRALESGRPVVVAQGDKLVRIEGTECVVLHDLPHRVKVDARIKEALN